MPAARRNPYYYLGKFKDVVGTNSIRVGPASAQVLVADSSGNLYQGGTQVTSTAAEMNALDGITATVSELNLLDGSTAGSIVASKAIVADSSGRLADADLDLNSTNALSILFGGVGALEIDDAAISGFAAAADTAGKDVYVETQDGGTDGGTASTGQDGGDFSLKAGDGSAAVTTDANGGTGGSLTLSAGASGAGDGAGHSGKTGKVDLAAGLLCLSGVQTIDMGDAAKSLTLDDQGDVQLTGNVLFVDPASGQASEDLTLPPEADSDGLLLIIANTGGEHIVVKDDATNTIVTIEDTEIGICVCDGTTWYGTRGLVD